uniref:Uncharacterized protein n=1 Tax=Anguilla anguilla TaxID=7936 RepID=A0A0E9V711_ANGAN
MHDWFCPECENMTRPMREDVQLHSLTLSDLYKTKKNCSSTVVIMIVIIVVFLQYYAIVRAHLKKKNY